MTSNPPLSSSPLLESNVHQSASLSRSRSNWSRSLITAMIVACLSSVQYGYHMAELNAPESVMSCTISVPGPQQNVSMDGKLVGCIPMNSSQIGMITSAFSIGGLVASSFAGSLSDQYGRKLLFILNSIIYTIGSFIEYYSNSYHSILLGRFVSGMAAGSGLVVVPIYINEISPIELRGLLGSMNQVCVNFGILLTQTLAINWANDSQWRLLLGTGGIIGIINLLGCLVIYESPKWLVINDKQEENGSFVLQKLRNNDLMRCSQEVEIWKQESRLNSSNSDTKVTMNQYLSDKTYENSRIVATFIMLGQQMCGINSIIFYGVKVLVELFPQQAVLINCLISFGNMSITFISSLFLDKLGRKPLLQISVAIMGLASISMGVGIINKFPILSATSTFIYVGSFAIGCGPIPFLLISEVSQLEVKGVAQSWGTNCNLISTFLIGFLFPIVNSAIGGYVYFIFAIVSVVFLVFIYTFVPETKGKHTYQEVWGIHRVD